MCVTTASVFRVKLEKIATNETPADSHSQCEAKCGAALKAMTSELLMKHQIKIKKQENRQL